MTSFIDVQHPAEHPGVVRITTALAAAGQLKKQLSGPRGLTTLMLSAIAAAATVVAYQLMDSVAEGNLLVVWIALWALAFAVLALFAGATRRLATRTVGSLNDWSQAIAQARADVRLWEAAKSDPRIMADLQVAIARHEGRTGEADSVAALPSWARKSETPPMPDFGRVLRS